LCSWQYLHTTTLVYHTHLVWCELEDKGLPCAKEAGARPPGLRAEGAKHVAAPVSHQQHRCSLASCLAEPGQGGGSEGVGEGGGPAGASQNDIPVSKQQRTSHFSSHATAQTHQQHTRSLTSSNSQLHWEGVNASTNRISSPTYVLKLVPTSTSTQLLPPSPAACSCPPPHPSVHSHPPPSPAPLARP
jgi:hypothetical protein